MASRDRQFKMTEQAALPFGLVPTSFFGIEKLFLNSRVFSLTDIVAVLFLQTKIT